MANLFDAANAPITEPLSIVAGGFVQWKRTDLGADYSNSGYTATYKARVMSGGNASFSITGTASGEDYLFSVSNATSVDYETGKYKWQLYITRTSDSASVLVDEGEWEVITDIGESSADTRSHARIMVDKIESLLNGKADSDVSNYSVAGRSLTKLSFDELVKARDYYRAEVIREQAKELSKKGKATGATIKVRFI